MFKGIIFGFILFIIYINDIFIDLIVIVKIYVDDIKIYYIISILDVDIFVL